jgi:hypothetical protein
VDRHLPILVRALSSPEDNVAFQAAHLLSRHPLFGLKRGPWTPPANLAPLQKVYFPGNQLDEIAQVLIEITRTTPVPLRRRLVELLAQFEGLESLVDGSALALDESERLRYEHLRLEQSLRQFKPQVTVVLSYECNKRCDYCFVAALSREMPRPISRPDFVRAVEWGCRAGVSRIPVTGGEPTLHPEFAELMSELRARQLTTCFSTNGCGPRAAFECLSPELVETITFHILDDGEYTPRERALLEENIRCVKDKGIPLIFRYVLHTAGAPPWQAFLALSERYRPVLVSCSPAFPGPYRREMSREVRALFQSKDNLLLLVRTVLRSGLRPIIAKPIPLCMFLREEWLHLAATTTLTNVCDVFQNGYANDTLINPDLTLYPCMALPLTGARQDSTPSLEHFGECARRAVEPLQRTAMLAECPNCQLFRLRLCQPACLSFLLPQDREW